jgi:hypothetical protein
MVDVHIGRVVSGKLFGYVVAEGREQKAVGSGQ